jgi:hypothetical protein
VEEVVVKVIMVAVVVAQAAVMVVRLIFGVVLPVVAEGVLGNLVLTVHMLRVIVICIALEVEVADEFFQVPAAPLVPVVPLALELEKVAEQAVVVAPKVME